MFGQESVARSARWLWPAVTVLMVAACAGAPQSSVNEAPPPMVTQEPASAPAESSADATDPGATSVDLDATMFYSGFTAHITHAEVSDDGQTIRIEGEFKNLAPGTSDLMSFINGPSTIEWQGQALPLSVPVAESSTAPGSTTVRGAMEGSVPQGFKLGDATLVVGSGDEHQSRLSLRAGAAAESQLPRAFDVSGSLMIHRDVKVRFSDGMVVPALCSGTLGDFTFRPARRAEESVLLTVTQAAIRLQYPANTHSYLVGPDGTTGKGDPDGGYIAPHDTVRGQQVCYKVTAPAEGTYHAHWDHDMTVADSVFTFKVPAP